MWKPASKILICTCSNKFEEHQCKAIECKESNETICINITVQSPNGEKNHTANFSHFF